MSASSLFRLIFSFRLITAVAGSWLLFSTPGFAWQQNNGYPYRYYPQPQNIAPVYYPYPPARFYPAYRTYAPNQNGYSNKYRPQAYPRFQPVNFTNPAYPAAPTFRRQQRPQSEPSVKPVQRPPSNAQKNNDIDKQDFIAQLLPVIKRENRRLLQQRKKLQQLFLHINQQPLTSAQQKWLKKIARRYRVKQNLFKSAKARNELLSKVDIIPPSLALAQAANESAWGKSRFATEANNLFGIWTYDASKGIVPQQRSSGKKHLVRKFNHVGDSIVYYIHTLNSHPAYQKLRELRQQLRLQQKPIDGHALASGLEHYSARGNQYIESIRKLIRQNQWAGLDRQDQAA
jgi:Bax protein